MELPLEVAKNIYLVQLPLPFALRSVNCYLLQDHDGWSIVDTGLNTPQARATWQAAFASLGISPQAINRIVLTHSHPDHYGLAGWLQELCANGRPELVPPVLMSPLEAEFARLAWQTHEGWPDIMLNFFAHCGLPPEISTSTTAGIEQVRSSTLPHPDRVEMLKSKTTLPMGGRNFEVWQVPGHSDGQLIFYDAADQLLLCGDQVLLTITPNISLWPFSEANPLGRYLVSLRQLAGLEVRLALPGHRALITNWQQRLAELEAHHAARLEQMLAVVDHGITPYEISQQIFNFDSLSAHEIRFAVTETLAHLEYLVRQQQLERTDDGVWRYGRSYGERKR